MLEYSQQSLPAQQQEPQSLPLPSAESVISAMTRIRDKIKDMEADFALQVKPYKEAQEKVERIALAVLESQGAQSLKTPAGTMYRTTRSSVSVEDKQAFMDYIIANSAFELMDVRGNKTAVEEHLEQCNDLPPGVSIRRTVAVNFRRA